VRNYTKFVLNLMQASNELNARSDTQAVELEGCMVRSGDILRMMNLSLPKKSRCLFEPSDPQLSRTARWN
jgi:hypothetical protein